MLGKILIAPLFLLDAAAEPTSAEEPMRVPQAREAITVDGRLDDPGWAAAMIVDLPFETWPGNNTTAAVETSCLITYDSDHLYVAFKASDPEPHKIRAHLSDRDDAWKDDYVGVTLDTFNDQRRAFELFVNPLGVQMDRFNDDVRREKDEAWDTIWHSAGRITDEGYVVEMAIPFYSLRFPASDLAQTWGFEAFRFMPRNQDVQLRSQPRDRDRNCHLCQISQLTGLESLSAGRNLEIVPTLTSTSLESREDFPNGGFSGGDVDVDPGLTVKWGVTPNMILNGTLNPDFSQVEADVAQLDVNTRFALFFPERRPFFLEGADVFKTPMRAVFTRNVADPDWGVKLTGKTGRHALGVFAADDQITNLLLPGSQTSATTTLEEKSTNAALRYRRDVGTNGAVGALLTSRSGGDYSNRVFGVDALFQFKQSNRISFQALGSDTTYPEALATAYGQPDGSFGGTALRLGFSHHSQNWIGWGQLQDISDDFRADLGFLPETGQLFIQAGSERIWWGDEDDWQTSWRLGAEVNHREDQSGQRLEDSAFLWVTLEGPLQSTSWITVSQFDRFFAGREFLNNHKIFIHTELQPTGDLWFFLEGDVGDEVDFANVRQGRTLSLEPQLRYTFGQHLRATLQHNFRRLEVDEGELFTANLTQLRLVYQLNVRSFVRLITQLTAIDRDPSLYVEPVEAKTERLFNQLLFSYKINPQTALFFGYSDNRLGDERIDLTERDRNLFLKIGYAWVM